jgi:hypothetical protein
LDVDADVAAVLARTGWTPARAIDEQEYTASLEAEGFVFSDAARQVLRSLGGLTVRCPVSPEGDADPVPCEFDPEVAARGVRNQFHAWERTVGGPLAPVAELGHWIVSVSAEGGMYIGRRERVEVVGDSVAEGLRWLCLGEGTPRALEDAA